MPSEAGAQREIEDADIPYIIGHGAPDSKLI